MTAPITHDRLIELGFRHRLLKLYLFPDEMSDAFELKYNGTVKEWHIRCEGMIIRSVECTEQLDAFYFGMTDKHLIDLPCCDAERKRREDERNGFPKYKYRPVEKGTGLRIIGHDILLQPGESLVFDAVRDKPVLPDEAYDPRDEHTAKELARAEAKLDVFESIPLNQPLTHDDIVKVGWSPINEINYYNIGFWELSLVSENSYKIRKRDEPHAGSYNGPIPTPSDLHAIMKLLNIKA